MGVLVPTEASPPLTPPRPQQEQPSDKTSLSKDRNAVLQQQQPFFLMDWLDEWTHDCDKYALAALLHTPQRHNHKTKRDGSSVSSPKSPYDYQDDYHDVEDNEENSLEPPRTPKSGNTLRHKLGISISCPKNLGRPDSLSPIRPCQLGYDDDGEDDTKDKDPSPQSEPRRKVVVRRPKSPHTIYRKSIALGNAWNAKGLYKAEQGEWEAAVACWEQALEIRRALLGSTHEDVASTLNNQGIALGQVGRILEAIASLEEALAIRKDLWKQQEQQQTSTAITPRTKNEDPSTNAVTTILSTLHNLSNVHAQGGATNQAIQVLEEARALGQEYCVDKDVAACAALLPRARIAVTLGHLHWKSGQAGPAQDALLEARDLLFEERRRLQAQAASFSNDNDDAWEGAILATQQELIEVERDLQDMGVTSIWR